MAEKNKIDNLFKSKLDSLEIKPSGRSGMGIEAELERQSVIIYKRKINNYRIATVTIGLTLVLFITYFSFNRTQPETPVINTEKVNPPVNEAEETKAVINSSAIKTEKNISKAKQSTQKQENRNNTELQINNVILANNKINNNIDVYIQDEINTISLMTPVNLYQLEFVDKDQEFVIPSILEFQTSAENTIDNDIAQSITETTIINDIKTNVVENPVSVALFYSPHYSYCIFTDNTPGNNIDEVQMYNDIEDSEFSYSTGMALRYQLTDRWAFSAGLTYATVVKSVSLLTVYADMNSSNEMYYAYTTSSGVIEIPDKNNSAHIGDTLRIDKAGEKILKYIHLPLMAKYSINKNKFIWFLNGGPSVNFLVQDKAKINAGGKEETILNKTQGLNKTSFGFVIGAGMEYKLTKNLNILAEPVFKGTFTSITDNTSVKNYPYSIGANFGITIGF